MKALSSQTYFKLLAAIAIVFFCTLLIYTPSQEGSLVYDSREYLTDNSHITEISLENLEWMLTSHRVGNWHPVTWLSFAIDYRIYGGLDKHGFQLTNSIFHGLNSALLMLLIISIMRISARNRRNVPGPQSVASLITPAFISAIIFALHPQHVESVAWVAERKDVLFMFFTLLTFLSYIYYSHNGKHYRAAYIFSVCCYLMAVMSKPMAVTVPVLLLLIDIYLHSRNSFPGKATILTRTKGLIVDKIPFFLVSALTIIITLESQESAINTLHSIPMDSRILNAIQSISLYLTKALVPLGFSTFYPHYHFAQDINHTSLISGFILIILISYVSVHLWRKNQPGWLLAWLFFLVSLSPVIGIISVGLQGAADRWAYLSTLPLYLLLAESLSRARHNRVTRWISFSFALLFIMHISIETMHQKRVWDDPLSVWINATSSFPGHGYAHGHLGAEYYNLKDFGNAFHHFNIANQKRQLLLKYLVPYSFSAIIQLEHDEAIKTLGLIIANSEQHSMYDISTDCAYLNTAWSMTMLGRPDEAQENLDMMNRDNTFNQSVTILAEYIQQLKSDPAEISEYHLKIDYFRHICTDYRYASSNIISRPLW